MYVVVDAYDRAVPTELRGRPESLSPIRQRLLGIFNRPMTEEDLDPAAKDAWIFRLGGPAVSDAARAASSANAGAGAGVPAASRTGASATVSNQAPPTAAMAPSPPTQPGTQPQTKKPSETPTP
jgi:hypothetical protein